MTPTQEQILKDALEIIATDEKTYIGHGDYYEGPFSGEYCQRVARKAIEAAAAGVGERMEWPKEFWDEFLRVRKREEINETIERCAQELEAAFAECNTLNLLHGAARLRALKDKLP
jgi:hypothetical protein